MIDPIRLELPNAIETERLHLRPPRAGDGAALHEAIVESLTEMRRFLASLPWVAGEQRAEVSEAWCRDAHANFQARKDLPFLLFEKRSDQLLGATGLHRPVWSTRRVEVGYWCRTSRHREGFMTEAVEAVSRYALTHTHAVRIELLTDEENLPSRKVAERCGFVLEGILRHERRAPDGTLRNTCMYARFPGPG
ncbi:MAG: GNAT family N-acetyltransferase [Deltaproteobacteria bacterium]|nr:GNAT family N-acetyltransferase [Deltaproteobacteria bacterium]